ncbi:MAG: hypothetical protein PWR20_875 [Bacteroidales bacterium]|jgi:hypothetical protein|nr:hypothetical protein [Bacteroidales bacterium]MDN5329598.1 hypothetical protein [Bacteroidales bacterium]
MHKKNLMRFILFLGFLVPLGGFCQDTQDNIIKWLKEGNAKELAKVFNPALTFSVPGHDGIYSPSQAEGFLKLFFEDNKPVSFRVSHQGKSADGARFLIGILTCNTGAFKVYSLTKMMEGRERIIQFQIEPNQD